MPRRLVISPHLDDAVYSVGQSLGGIGGDTIVLTILAGVPPTSPLTPYDAACGFATSHEAVRARRRENHRACTVLDVRHAELPFLDSQYEPLPTAGVLERAVTSAVEKYQPDEVWVPLGVHHPDHEAVAGAALAVCQSRPLAGLVVYEELPYRVWHPEATAARLLAVAPVERTGFSQADRRVKQAAVECYRSQLDDDIRASLLVPERLWRLPTRKPPAPAENEETPDEVL